MSSRLVESRIAPEISAIGFTVGCNFKTFLQPLRAKAANSGVVPDVGAIAPEAAKLDVVQVRFLAVPKYEHEFMAGTVKRSHTAVAFYPNAEIEKFASRRATGSVQFRDMAPIRARKN